MKLVTLLALCLCALVALGAAGQLSAQTSTMGATPTLSPGSTTATTTSPLAPTTLSSASALPAATTGATPTVLNVVEITRLVPAGTTTVTAFTVPTGQTLIVTDVLVTNTSTEAVCGAAINRAGGSTTTTGSATGTTGTTATGTTPTTSTTTGTTTTTPGTGTSTSATPGTTTPTLAGTLTQTDSTITGPLCIAARTTTPLNLTTGIEFGPGQTVQLVNSTDTTAANTTAGTTPTAGAVGFHLRGVLVAG